MKIEKQNVPRTDAINRTINELNEAIKLIKISTITGTQAVYVFPYKKDVLPAVLNQC